MNNIIKDLLIILLIVAATAGFVCGIKAYSNKQDKAVNDTTERFSVISREWCDGATWSIILDRDTDQLYLKVGNTRPERIEE